MFLGGGSCRGGRLSCQCHPCASHHFSRTSCCRLPSHSGPGLSRRSDKPGTRVHPNPHLRAAFRGLKAGTDGRPESGSMDDPGIPGSQKTRTTTVGTTRANTTEAPAPMRHNSGRHDIDPSRYFFKLADPSRYIFDGYAIDIWCRIGFRLQPFGEWAGIPYKHIVSHMPLAARL